MVSFRFWILSFQCCTLLNFLRGIWRQGVGSLALVNVATSPTGLSFATSEATAKGERRRGTDCGERARERGRAELSSRPPLQSPCRRAASRTVVDLRRQDSSRSAVKRSRLRRTAATLQPNAAPLVEPQWPVALCRFPAEEKRKAVPGLGEWCASGRLKMSGVLKGCSSS